MDWPFLRVFAAGAASVGIPLTIAVAVLMRRRAVALAELSKGVSALEEGKPVRPVQSRVGGATGRLARRFNAVAPRLEERIAQLEEERQQLRAVLSGMAEGVIAVDARRRLVFANPGAEKQFGLGSGAAGRLVPELIRVPQVQEAVEATLSGPEGYRGEICVPVREAQVPPGVRTLSVHGTPLPGWPPPGAVLVFHDVTELRRLERMRQDFVANASHELKTPLASIKAYTETLLDWALHDDAVNVRLLRQIEEQADRLDRLIHDMLSLARLETGEEAYRHGPLAPSPVVRTCAENHRNRAEAKRLDFRIDLGCLEESALIRADEEALRQILDNLIDNAIKYTPEGGWVRVSCRVARDALVLEVADSGVGIPRDDLPRVFERFYRVDRARSRELGGTGLGLSIVKHQVQSLGGQVAVDSRVGAGSVFTVRIPCFRPPP
jgi:two-component system, OmpR family, phosphate regulon sensor histidine kinase PhoR